jgi:hypothetical protein
VKNQNKKKKSNFKIQFLGQKEHLIFSGDEHHVPRAVGLPRDPVRLFLE